jgi:hypothetical protein
VTASSRKSCAPVCPSAAVPIMPGRRSRVPSVYDVHIPVDIAAHPQAAHALLAAVIKHLSYAREQCHAPYTQLEVHAKVRPRL